MKNLVLLTGENDYALRLFLREQKEKFMQKHGELNLTELDGEKTTGAEIWNAATTLPFLGERRLVIVEGLPTSTSVRSSEALQTKEEFLLQNLPNLPEETVLTFVSPRPDNRRKFAKELQKIADIKEFIPLEGAILTRWVEQKMAHQNLRAEPGTAQKLAELTGGDLWTLEQEIDKLATFAGANELPADALEKLVHAQVEEDIFKLTDALGKKQTRSALARLQRLLESGESVQQIFFMLVRQVRLIAGAKALLDENRRQDIAAKLKIPPFTVSSVATQAQNLSWPEIKKMYAELLQIDLGMKTSRFETSADDTRELELALEKFLVACGQ